MSRNLLDISYHTVPTMAVGIACGFMAAFGIHAATLLEQILWITPATVFALAFSVLWSRREMRQHDGHTGGQQSRLEGLIPLAAGPICYAASTYSFWKWPI